MTRWLMTIAETYLMRHGALVLHTTFVGMVLGATIAASRESERCGRCPGAGHWLRRCS
jgi:hypothetical protein